MKPLTEREIFASDITGIIYSHLLNYGNYEYQDTLAAYRKFSQTPLSEEEIKDMALQIEEHMRKREADFQEWIAKMAEDLSKNPSNKMFS